LRRRLRHTLFLLARVVVVFLVCSVRATDPFLRMSDGPNRSAHILQFFKFFQKTFSQFIASSTMSMNLLSRFNNLSSSKLVDSIDVRDTVDNQNSLLQQKLKELEETTANFLIDRYRTFKFL